MGKRQREKFSGKMRHTGQKIDYEVSIITVCLNSVDTIRDTIISVLSQDYPNIEYIIVDGESQDGTMKIVEEYRDRIAVIMSEPDKGIYDAMNKGIAVATGDIVGILNSDDFYSDATSVRRLVEQMLRTNADCVFADVVFVDSTNTDRVTRYYDSSKFFPERLRYGWMPAHPSLMVKRTIYLRYGNYKLDYKIASDFEMIVRLLLCAGLNYAYLPHVVIKMRTGGVSTKGLRARWILNREIVRACRSNGIKTSLPRILLKIPVKLLELFRKPG